MTHIRAIETLQRRLEFLRKRLDENYYSERAMPRALAEAAAVEYAIKNLCLNYNKPNIMGTC